MQTSTHAYYLHSYILACYIHSYIICANAYTRMLRSHIYTSMLNKSHIWSVVVHSLYQNATYTYESAYYKACLSLPDKPVFKL